MITLTRCNGTSIMLNEAFIELAEETPDTVITMNNGHRYIVKEKLDEISARIAEFHKFVVSAAKNAEFDDLGNTEDNTETEE